MTADGRSTRAETKDIELYGRQWGKRLEITLSRTQPVGVFHAAGVRDLQRPGGAALLLVREERDRQGTDDQRLGRVLT